MSLAERPFILGASGNREIFSHERLEHPDRQLRLLKLVYQASGDACLVFSLETWNTDTKPHYAAISYMWGTELNHTADIVVNDKPFKVRGSTFRALTQAIEFVEGGQKERASGIEYFWIDAICINQDDLHEKSFQVRMMGNIFEDAQAVFACLGLHRENSEKVFVPQTRLAGVEAINAFEALCNRQYWCRLWIVQEILLSAADAYVLCGPDGMHIMNFTMFWANVRRELPDTNFGVIAMRLQGVNFRKTLGSMRNRVPMVTGLRLFGRQMCADPRDRLFGLSQLLIWPEQCKPIKADYNLTTTDIALALIRMSAVQRSSVEATSIDDQDRPNRVVQAQYTAYYRDHVLDALGLPRQSAIPGEPGSAGDERANTDQIYDEEQTSYDSLHLEADVVGRVLWRDGFGATRFVLHRLSCLPDGKGFYLEPQLILPGKGWTDTRTDEDRSRFWTQKLQSTRYQPVRVGNLTVGMVCPAASAGDFIIRIVPGNTDDHWLVLRHIPSHAIYEIIGNAWLSGYRDELWYDVDPEVSLCVQLFMQPEDVVFPAKRQSRWSSFAVPYLALDDEHLHPECLQLHYNIAKYLDRQPWDLGKLDPHDLEVIESSPQADPQTPIEQDERTRKLLPSRFQSDAWIEAAMRNGSGHEEWKRP